MSIQLGFASNPGHRAPVPSAGLYVTVTSEPWGLLLLQDSVHFVWLPYLEWGVEMGLSVL